MGTLAFFPWLQLRSATTIRDFELVAFRRGAAPLGGGTNGQAVLDMLLEPYREAPAGPVREATLLRLHQKEVLDSLSEAEIDQVLRFGELVAFAGLAERRYFDHLGYSNRDNYRLVVQEFTDPSRGMAVVSRRRDGSSRTIITKPALLVLKPLYVAPLGNMSSTFCFWRRSFDVRTATGGAKSRRQFMALTAQARTARTCERSPKP